MYIEKDDSNAILPFDIDRLKYICTNNIQCRTYHFIRPYIISYACRTKRIFRVLSFINRKQLKVKSFTNTSMFWFDLYRFYWFINAGSFIAFLGVAYIQQNVSFSLGYLIPFISMIVALVIFVAVKSKYKQTPPGGESSYQAQGPESS